MSRRILDTFLYYDEDMLLKIRLKYLYKYIDFFFIIECDHDFNFNKKKFNFNIENFLEYKDKIIYIKYKFKNIKNENDWSLHDEIRDKLYRKMRRYSKKDDLIIHGDLDEFPNIKYFNFLKNISKNDNKIYCLRLKNFFFKFNLLDDNHCTLKTKITLFKNIKSFSHLRDLKGKEYKCWRIDNYFKKKRTNKIKILKYGGWHFTWIKSNKDIIKKFKSVIEFKNKKIITEDYINNKINQRQNFIHEIYGFKSSLKLVDIEQDFPKNLSNIIKKYIEFID